MKLPNNTGLKPLTQQEIDSIITFYSAWKLKKPNLLDDVVTSDWQDIPLGPGQAQGPQGLKDIINYFIMQCPDVEIEIHEIFGSHERAGVRAVINFTHNAEILGIPPSGKKVSVALHEFHYLKDGKLTHTWHLEDWFSLIKKDNK
ncbi:ester cyclase [Mucilaginibacter pallidiroseus]|uniref:Ester cyclase n=1 Tax=Mucilaginibacter pallidiroseus TaxID=2599295 RepID=A0A563UIM9_9SPHI|nr:ester cyclase [Mucilaginibacter pallidiroseus]TWR31118.1 ester cyclase [Mucilaginibacter pallidiroseus]